MCAALNILLVTPAPRGTHRGNRVTAQRWARMLRKLDMRVRIATADDGKPADCLVALHAHHSAAAIEQFHRRHPERPIIVAMTGTDLYRYLPDDPQALRAIDRACQIILLQPEARTRLPPSARHKSRVIYQSVTPLTRPRPRQRTFDVCVLAHLRAIKDPLRTALASRALPQRSRIRVLHAGGELDRGWAAQARAEEKRNKRYSWLGELRPGAARQLLVRSRLMVLSSEAEGGANAVGEALALGTPILASRIDGNTGLLGRRYPGLFSVGATEELSRLLQRAENDAGFYRQLGQACAAHSALFAPERERDAWRQLFTELAEIG